MSTVPGEHWPGERLGLKKNQTPKICAGYLHAYRLVNPTASSFLHVTHLGLLKRFESSDDPRIGLPLSMSWVMQALVSGNALTLGTVHTLIQCFHPEREWLYESSERDYGKAWPPIEVIPES
jgi:hypothetical protein